MQKQGLTMKHQLYKHQQRFGLDIQFSTLVHNFNFIFSIGHLYWAGRAMNSLPSQILNVGGKLIEHSMKRKATIFTFSVFGLVFMTAMFLGCSRNHKNVYHEADYVLVKVDTFNGRTGTEYYNYKYDTSRKLQINFWGDGKLMAKAFTHHGKMDGWRTMYDYTGKLMALDSFNDGKKILSKIKPKVDTSVKMFSNGKLVPFTSIDSLLK